jgi:hypothetical protein
MKSFERFLSQLATIPDPRRAKGKKYKLSHVLLFSICALVTGANSYRGLCTFMTVHRRRLNKAFGIKWMRAPAHTAIRYILQGLRTTDVEAAFRDHATTCDNQTHSSAARGVAIDGKTLRGSFDGFRDTRAKQVLNAFATHSALILAHFDIDDKSNEIPAAQALFAALGLTDTIVTLDALHCQKKHSTPPQKRTRI